MKTLIAIATFALFAFTSTAQIAELNAFNGTGFAKKLSTDSSKIGEQNFVGGSFNFYTNLGVGITAQYSLNNSWFDTTGYSREHYEVGLGFHRIGAASAKLGMDQSYNFLAEVTASYYSDTKTDAITYVGPGENHRYQRLNKTQGAIGAGKIGLYSNDNEVKFFASHILSAEMTLPISTYLISTFDDDTLVPIMTGEEKAKFFYKAAFQEEVFSFPVSLNFAIAGDVGISLGDLNNYQFGKAMTYSGSLKIKNYLQRQDCNSVTTTLELGYERSNHYGFISKILFVKLDILGLTRMLKRQ